MSAAAVAWLWFKFKLFPPATAGPGWVPVGGPRLVRVISAAPSPHATTSMLYYTVLSFVGMCHRARPVHARSWSPYNIVDVHAFGMGCMLASQACNPAFGMHVNLSPLLVCASIARG
ncbi:hypothetical protein BJV78DRAFT_1219278 [Lactifluus subvellereus]|nr:hypothetical protein BJV78DRAFT_1219278 [Lactifluus subvellereus]